MGKILLTIVLGVFAFFGFTKKAQGKDIPIIREEESRATPYEGLFKKYAERHRVPWQILSAIAFVESSYRREAVNYNDNESIGLMQVLCKPDGNGGCSNDFPAVIDWNITNRKKLLEPDWNVHIGSQILGWNIQQYGLEKGIAVYNAWNQRLKVGPPFSNQNYVDKVLEKAKELGYEKN